MVLWQGEKRKRAAEGIVSVLLSVLTVFAGTAYQQYAGVPEGSRKVIYLFLQILLWTVLYFAGSCAGCLGFRLFLRAQGQVKMIK